MMRERRLAKRRRALVLLTLNTWHRCGQCFHVKERHTDATTGVLGHCTVCGCKVYDPKARTRW